MPQELERSALSRAGGFLDKRLQAFELLGQVSRRNQMNASRDDGRFEHGVARSIESQEVALMPAGDDRALEAGAQFAGLNLVHSKFEPAAAIDENLAGDVSGGASVGKRLAAIDGSSREQFDIIRDVKHRGPGSLEIGEGGRRMKGAEHESLKRIETRELIVDGRTHRRQIDVAVGAEGGDESFENHGEWLGEIVRSLVWSSGRRDAGSQGELCHREAAKRNHSWRGKTRGGQ